MKVVGDFIQLMMAYVLELKTNYIRNRLGKWQVPLTLFPDHNYGNYLSNSLVRFISLMFQTLKVLFNIILLWYGLI